MRLPALVFLALIAFATALFGSTAATRAGWLHLALAVGAMPLIFGAMSHFIPVLTRSRAAPAALALVPPLSLAGGALAALATGFPALHGARHAGALLALAATAALLAWSIGRRAAALGRPHPGLGWYQAALACLALGLGAILAGALWPEHAAALRRLHLHLNLLGFIGLTAVGTLAVLLPTAAGRPDPAAAARLRRDLPLALAGTGLVAAGAAWFAPLAAPGAVLWALPLARLAAGWLRGYRGEILSLHGAPPPLAAALVLFAGSLVLGALVPLAARGWIGPVDPVLAFAAGFLPPLVTGAASELLPVWLRPGARTRWHAALRRRLGRYNGIRAALFLAAGIAAGTGFSWGPPLAAATLAWFLANAVAALAEKAGRRG
jgi:hypothetical protein